MIAARASFLFGHPNQSGATVAISWARWIFLLNLFRAQEKLSESERKWVTVIVVVVAAAFVVILSVDCFHGGMSISFDIIDCMTRLIPAWIIYFDN